MGSIVHRSVPTNLKWLPNCSHAHALFQDTVEVSLSQPCFDHFFRPCFKGHDEAGLLAFEALRGSPRPARGQASDAKRNGTRTKRGSRGLESI